jgi:hypothetical protein
LGPLLFLIYINDLPKASSLLSNLFADDTTQFASHKNIQHLTNFVNTEFQKTVSFFNTHRLSLNIKKTQFMIFSNSKFNEFPNIFIEHPDTNNPGVTIKTPLLCLNQTDSPYYKYLGVYFDPALSFKYHVTKISSKLSSALFFLRKAKNILNQRALKSIYYAIFHSHLIYAVHVWSCCAESTIKPIVQKQKAAIRILCKANYNSHTEPLFKKLNILPFPKLVEFFKLQFMQHFTQKLLPKALENMWVTNVIRRIDQPQVQLRDDDQLFIPLSRTSLTSRLPLATFPKIWEDFPDDDIKFQRDKIVFNSRLKTHLLSQLSSTINCNRLLCPDCHLNQINDPSVYNFP